MLTKNTIGTRVVERPEKTWSTQNPATGAELEGAFESATLADVYAAAKAAKK